jgi:site-specific DNA recombinase
MDSPMKPHFPGMRADRLPKSKQARRKTDAVIYCRVSTKEQEKNLSLPVQEQTCREYCDTNGWNVLRVFKDAESAKTTNRTQFLEMLKYCTENFRSIAAVVFHDASRFSRETEDYYQVKGYLKSKGIDTRSATQGFDSSPSGEFMETLLAGWATYDNRLRADKTIRGMKAAQEQGRWVHRAPIGYRNVPNARRDQANLVQDTERAPLIRRAFELYATDAQPKVKILEHVTNLGLKDISGKALSAQEFDKLLRNPIYAGWIVSEAWGIKARGMWEPIISEDLFERIQARFSGNSTSRQTRSQKNPDFPLRIFVRCEVCGKPITGSKSKGNGGRYAYYFCREPSCAAVRFKPDDLHHMFIQLLYSLFPEESFMPLFHAIVTDVWKQKQAQHEEAAALVKKRIADVEARKQLVVDAVIEKRIDKATYDDQMAIVGTELSAAQSQLAGTLVNEEELECLLQFADWLLERVAGIWNGASAENKRRIQSALFPDGLTVTKEGFGTTSTAIFFKQLQAVPVDETEMASPGGFEPPLPP